GSRPAQRGRAHVGVSRSEPPGLRARAGDAGPRMAGIPRQVLAPPDRDALRDPDPGSRLTHEVSPHRTEALESWYRCTAQGRMMAASAPAASGSGAGLP